MQSYKKRNTFITQMEEIKDFESFYNTKLKPSLQDLKLHSNDASGWSISALLFGMFAIFCFLLQQIFIAILLLIFALVSIYKYTKKKDLFIENYKETVIAEIIKYLNPGLTYKPNEYMSPSDYEKSNLYRKIYDYYSGSDFISGVYNKLQFYCSELEVAHDKPFGMAYGGNTVTTIFKGLFFATPLKIYFPGAVYIWPKGEEQLAGSMMDVYYKLLPLPDVYYVSTNDSFFENNFSVYSTNPSAALSFADHDLMQRLIKFKEDIEKDVRLSFVGGVCYVSISINRDLLKPSMLKPDSKETIKEYFVSVQLIFNVIDQLNLSRFV